MVFVIKTYKMPIKIDVIQNKLIRKQVKKQQQQQVE